MREELDESARLAPVFAAERADAIAWLVACERVAVAPAAAEALANAHVLRLVACAHTALDHRRRIEAMTVDAFCAAIREPARWSELLARYPVVARLLDRAQVKWRETMGAFLDAIARDHEVLGTTCELLDVRTRAGRLGARRATLIVTLGGGARWVYRVYDRRMARWFQDVCAALSPWLSTALHARTIHVRDGYSWDEFVVAGPCATVDEAKRFFVRAGMLVRLAERLATTDMHCENVLAAGEYPVFVDVETLFSVIDIGATPALEAFHLSPLRAGLLGPPSYGDPGRRAISRAGFHPGGRLVLPVTAERLAPMDEPVGGLVSVFPVETISATMPAPIADHVDEVIAGYDEMERVLAAGHLDPWLASARELPVRDLGAGGQVHDHALHRGLAVDLLENDAKRDAWLAQQPLSAIERDAIRDLELPRTHTVVGDHAATRSQAPFTAAQLARRHDLIRTAIALGDDRPAIPTPRRVETASPTSHAVAIGDALLDVRFGGGDWHGAVWIPWAGVRTFDIVGPDLLSGRGGIALAFAYLFRITSLPRFRDAALAALVDQSDLYSVLGGYVGLGSSVYVRARCATLLGAPQLADAARADLAYLSVDMIRDAPIDLVTGVSGLALASRAVGVVPAALVNHLETATERTYVLSGGVPAWVPPPLAARVIARARLGRNVSLPVDLPLAWRPTPDIDAIAIALGTPGDLFADVDLALAGVRAAPADARFRAALVDRAERLLERRARTGRWNPETSVAERHDLSVLTGVCAAIHALLAAEAADEVHSVRRLE